jgi:MFS family permease
VVVILAQIFVRQIMGPWLFLAVLVVAFFLASAGASAAYLTVSEIFPMETRALAIAFFYAVGTAAGGITGPLLFGNFINSGDRGLVAWAFYIGAIVMAIGGIVELLYGVKAEQVTLEDLAMPLTAADAEQEGKTGEHQPQ